MIVFDKSWFNKYQKPLLKVANTWLGKRFFRISGDVPKGCRIIGITPHSFTWLHQQAENCKQRPLYSTDFRTHEKFGKRLYHGLKPFWWTLHYLDEFFIWLEGLFVWEALRISPPRVNFGFDTLTAYPAAGANSPMDGVAVHHDAAGRTWSSLRGAGGTNA